MLTSIYKTLPVSVSVSVSSRVMMRQRKHDHITPTFRIRLATCAWLHSPQAGHENLPHSLSLRSFCHTLHPVFSDQRVSHLLMYLGLRTEKQSNMASEPSDIYTSPSQWNSPPSNINETDCLFFPLYLVSRQTSLTAVHCVHYYCVSGNMGGRSNGGEEE